MGIVVVRRKMLIALGSLAAGYLLLTLALALFQRKLLYQPTRYASGTLDKVAANHGLRPWRNPGGTKIGWYRAVSNGTAQVKALIVHGNAGSAIDRLDFVDGLQSIAPVEVYILEYPGYGDRPGMPGQQAFLDAATEAFQLLTNTGPILVLGESLGTGVAAYLAGTFPNAVRGLLVFCPYNNMSAVAQYHMSVFPVRWILRDKFPSEDWLKKYRGPLAVLVAVHDVIVPARFGRDLYAGYAGPKKLWEVADGGHNDVCVRPLEWWREVFAFCQHGGDR